MFVAALVLYLLDPAPITYLLVMSLLGLVWAMFIALSWRTERWSIHILFMFTVALGIELSERIFPLSSQAQDLQGVLIAFGSSGALFALIPRKIIKFSRLPRIKT